MEPTDAGILTPPAAISRMLPHSSTRTAVPARTGCRPWRRRPRWLPLLSLLLATAAGAQETHRPLRTGGLGAETAALLLSGQEGGSIPLFALAVAGAADAEGKATVELFVEAPGEAILANHDLETARLELCLYALDGSRVVDSSLETVELSLIQDRDRLLASGVKSRSTLRLAAGSYTVRILLRNVQSGELGLRSLSIVVPAAESGPTLHALLVPDPSAGWLRLARSAAPPVAGFWPAARPVMAADRDADLHLLVRGLQPDSAYLELRGAGGESTEIPAAVSPAEGVAPTGLERWLVRARMPYLEPGDYELRLRVADAATSPPLPIVVRPGGAGTWARDEGPPPIAEISAEPPLPTVGDRRGSRPETAALTSRLAEEYRGALDRLAAADMPGAVTALTRLEATAFGHEGGATAVATAEIETARALVRTAGGSLVPLFDLHYRAYRRYLSSQSFRLSSHARDQLLDLVDLHLARQPEDATPATDILVVMANQLQQSGLARYSRVVFRRALQVDPAHEGALLGIATGLEKHGEYGEACDFLEQLLDSQPEHREARLRLAVNLARTQNRARSRRLLNSLVEAPTQDWILAVAYQELARDLIDRERLVEAERGLIAARERLPDDDQLRVLLAAVRDAHPAGASSDDSQLVVSSRADRPSARHRYQQWPRFDPVAGEQSTEDRLEALAAALQGLRGEA